MCEYDRRAADWMSRDFAASTVAQDYNTQDGGCETAQRDSGVGWELVPTEIGWHRGQDKWCDH